MAAMLGWLFFSISHAGVLALEEARQLQQSSGEVEPLMHKDEDCFPSCYKQVGFCNWCGNGNACCKLNADPQSETVPQECLGASTPTFGLDHQCRTASFKPGQYGPVSSYRISAISEAQCTTFMSSTGCGWTREESCPKQRRGSRGVAVNDGTLGYRCCCGLELWKDMNVRHTLTRQDRLYCRSYMEDKGCGWTQTYTCVGQKVTNSKGLAVYDGSKGYHCCCELGLWSGGDWSLAASRSDEGYSADEFGLTVGNNGLGGQTSTSLQPGQVISGQNANGGFSVGIHQGVQTNIRGNDDELEQGRNSQRTFLDNHNGGNSKRSVVHWNPSATFRSDNVGPITNHLSSAKGPCVFGICTDLDPDHAPGVKSFRSRLIYPTTIGVQRITVRHAYEYKDLKIKKLKIAEDAPLEEECTIDRFDGDDIWCEEKLKYQHLTGDGVFGMIKEDTIMARRFKMFDLVKRGDCTTPITTLARCNEAAVRLDLSDHWGKDDYLTASHTNPPWCYFTNGKLKFNSNGGNIGRCSSFDMCLCEVDASGSGSASVMEFEYKTSGICDTPVTTIKECHMAAVALVDQVPGLSQSVGQQPQDDYQSASSTDPPWCYFEGGLVKFNSNGRNTGRCSSADMCFCKKLKPGQVSQATSAVPMYGTGVTAAPTMPPNGGAPSNAAFAPLIDAGVTPAPTPAPTVAPAVAQQPAPLQKAAGPVVGAPAAPPQISQKVAGPVAAAPVVPAVQTALKAECLVGESKIEVLDQSLFKVGDDISIGGQENKKIIGFSSLVLDTPLAKTYPANTSVQKIAPPAVASDVVAPQPDGVGGGLSSIDRITCFIVLGAGFCLLLCGVALIFIMGQCKDKKKRSTDRERDLKDRMMNEAEAQPMIQAEAPISAQPMTQSNIMLSGGLQPPPPISLQRGAGSMNMQARSMSIPQNTVYLAAPSALIPQTTVYQAQPQLGMASPFASYPGVAPGGSMYTGSMYNR